eukprot:2262374-Prymnesium_polylepis.3
MLEVAAVHQFRTDHKRTLPAGLSPVLLPIASGNTAEVLVKDIFPCTRCFVQVDMTNLCIRWSRLRSISLYVVEAVTAEGVEGVKDDYSSVKRAVTGLVGAPPRRNSLTMLSAFKQRNTSLGAVHINYSDRGGVTRVLTLSMYPQKTHAWDVGLRALLAMIPRSASAAHWRWAMSCMAATNARGAAGFLRQSDIRSLLVRANASAHLTTATLKEVLDSVNTSMQQQPDGLLRTGPAGDVVQHAVWCLRSHKSQLLDTPQVVGLLLRLCTSSQRIKDLYDAYSLNGRFGLEQWLAFVSAEQAAPQATQLRASVCGGDSFEELRLAKLRFARKSAAESADAQADSEWSPLQFALQLLDRQNTVAAPARGASAADDLNNPLAHFWASCSHNSYIIGDQLTGISSAAACARPPRFVGLYRPRALAGPIECPTAPLLQPPRCVGRVPQDYRSLEIDCWDGAGSEPAVKHGHTLTTVEQFDEVARAIGECAFTSSELPVVLSLEVLAHGAKPRHARPRGEYTCAPYCPPRCALCDYCVTPRTALHQHCRCTAAPNSKISWPR